MPSRLKSVILFTALPPIIIKPFDPIKLIDPSKFSGLIEVVASMLPIAPFLNSKVAKDVSSHSILTPKVLLIAKTDLIFPPNHSTKSMWWEAWLESTPPSYFQVPLQSSWS